MFDDFRPFPVSLAETPVSFWIRSIPSDTVSLAVAAASAAISLAVVSLAEAKSYAAPRNVRDVAAELGARFRSKEQCENGTNAAADQKVCGLVNETVFAIIIFCHFIFPHYFDLVSKNIADTRQNVGLL